MAKTKRCWLVKTEPSTYSIDDLASDPQQTTCWDGVRNYQARNFLRDQMQVGDAVLLYHSNAEPSAVVGLAKVVRSGYPDPSAFDPNHHYYDPDSQVDTPRWFSVDLKLIKKFKRALPLSELRDQTQLDGLELLRKGSRLSVQPVSEDHFELITKLAK
jgi:predicted RNA-binding protein with PUA-like domain